MADVDVEIPHRALFKPSEVCELAKIQPYVLRSWELEFPALGVARSPGGPRVYRKSDVELVLRIRRLVFGQGLTVAGARRTIEEDAGGSPAPEPTSGADLFEGEVRRRLGSVRRELQSLFDMLSDGERPTGPVGPIEAAGGGDSGDDGRLPLVERRQEAPVGAGVDEALSGGAPARAATQKRAQRVRGRAGSVGHSVRKVRR